MRDDVTNGRLPAEVKDRSSLLRFILSRYQRPFLRLRCTLEMNHLMLIFYHISQLFTTPDVLFSFFPSHSRSAVFHLRALCVSSSRLHTLVENHRRRSHLLPIPN